MTTHTTPQLAGILRNTIVSAIALAAMLGALLSTQVNAESTEHVSLSIPNMVCMSCEMQIEAALTAVDGVDGVRFDGDAQQALVTFDAHRTTLDAILAATEAAGYPATVLAPDTDT